jgi:hypothetical protein
MTKYDDAKPGDLLRGRARPRHRGEILCHNEVAHLKDMPFGMNGFRYFVCKRGGEWKRCPCGWRPELGPHYALPEHVEYHRKRIAAGEPMTMWFPTLRGKTSGSRMRS